MKWFVRHVLAFTVALMIVAALTTAASLAVGSGLFLKPKDLTFYRDRGGVWQTIFLRETPLGAVSARVIQAEIYALAIGRDCPGAVGGQFLYQRVDGTGETPANQVTYRTPASLVPCLEADDPKVAHFAWQVLLFGVIPLRPVELTKTVVFQE